MKPLRGIRALTLHQPMASAVAAKVKLYENRPRNMFAAGRLPEWVGIHAGLGWWDITFRRLSRLWPGRPDDPGILPRGKLLGVMLIDRMEPYPNIAHRLDWTDREHVLLADPWATGPWCMHIAEVRLLDEPIAAKGNQTLWYPDEAAQVALRALVEAR